MESPGAEGDVPAGQQPLHLSSTVRCEAYLQLMFMATFVLSLLSVIFCLEAVSVLALAHKGCLNSHPLGARRLRDGDFVTVHWVPVVTSS